MWYLYYDEESPEADHFSYLAPYEEEEKLNVRSGGPEAYSEAKEKAGKVWAKIRASNRLAKNPRLVWFEELKIETAWSDVLRVPHSV